MHKRIILFVVVILLTVSSYAKAMTLTFSGNIQGQDMYFSVSGDVGGVNNIQHIYPDGQIYYEQIMHIISPSDWVVLDSLAPSTYSNAGESYMWYSVPSNGAHSRCGYSEHVGGYNASTLEFWGHSVSIGSYVSYNTIEDLLGINGAFTYSDITAYITNYSPDGSTVENRVGNGIEGSLTLVALDYTYTSNPNQLPSAVPEPATLSLFGLGLLGLVFKRKRSES